METYAKALLIATPVFVVLIFIELFYGWYKKRQTYAVFDTVASLSSGVTNSIKNLLGLGIALFTYPFLKANLGIFDLGSQWWVWALAFVFVDFAGYWSHRISHVVNLFWNNHIIHHSSERFNLACALRQPISDLLKYYPLLLLPAAIVGVPNEVVVTIAPIHLFLQFWYHTVHIGKLGWLEYIIITPSQHRVHHAINDIYLDKNLGQIFSVWDRIFGTFQEELDEEPAEYGVLKPVRTWNPIRINFMHLWQLIKDAFYARSLWDKLRIWFMPTGWRPADVAANKPLKYIEDVHHFTRYETPASTAFKAYGLFQLISVLNLFTVMLWGFPQLSRTDLVLFSAFLMVSIYGYSDLLDLKITGFIIEVLRASFGFWMLVNLTQWQGLYNVLDPLKILLEIYLTITLIGAVYFGLFERKTQLAKLV